MNKKLYIILPVVAGVVVAVWYVLSGSSSLGQNTRELKNGTGNIEKINVESPQKITINCKNGQSYQIIFKQGQSNYDDLVFDNCGSEGAETP